MHSYIEEALKQKNPSVKTVDPIISSQPNGTAAPLG